MDDHEKNQQLIATNQHRELTRQLEREAERQGLTEEALLAELKQTRRIIFTETYGNLSLK